MAQKKNSSTKRLTWSLLGSIAVIALLGITAKSMGWLDGKEARQVEIGTSERRTIVQIVSASGRIQPEEEVVIRPDVSGEVIELNVKEGDFVRASEVLVRIKPDIYQARIDELNATLLTQRSLLEQARAGMLQAEVEYLKKKDLYEKDLISELEYLQSENAYKGQKASMDAAQFRIQSAEASLRRAEEELAQTVIRAPKDGTITRLSIEQGERVLGNSQMAGTEMMRIARMDQMEILVDVNENDIVDVTVGDSARLEVDAYQNRMFDGVVTEIANSADVLGSGSAEQVTNYKVKIRVTTPHNLGSSGSVWMEEPAMETTGLEESPNFKPGMSATVDIRTQTVFDVVAVPIQAVTIRDFAEERRRGSGSEAESAEGETQASVSRVSQQEGDEADSAPKEDFRRVVFVVDADSVRRVEVETGISDNSHIQILSGLDQGASIVTGPYRVLSRELRDGEKVAEREPEQQRDWGSPSES